MDQRARNIKLLGILGILMLTAGMLHFIPGNRKSSLKNVAMFQLSDTASVDKITMVSNGFDNTLTRTENGWVINKGTKADENIMMVLLTVMKQVEILRPISSEQITEMKNTFDENAIEVSFYSDEDKIITFWAGSNENKTVSVFKSQEDEYYVVILPGYDSFVTGIFEISEIDWKDRLVVDATPTSLNRLSVSYSEDEKKGFIVDVENNFPQIQGISNLDTLALMDYLDQFQYFQADRFADLPKETQYDSLLNTAPYARFSFDNIGSKNDTEMTFYHRIPGDNMILGIAREGEPALFSYSRISGIFKSKVFFENKE